MRSQDRDGGFSLIEMVVSLGLVMVVFTAAASAFVQNLQGQASAESLDKASQLAQDGLEMARRSPWSTLGLYGGQEGYRDTYHPLPVVAALAHPVTTSPDAAATLPNAAPEQGAETSADEATVNLCPTNNAACNAPSSAGVIPVPLRTVPTSILGNNFTVRTEISWVHIKYPANLGGGDNSSDLANNYGAKRISITVTWLQEGKERTTYQQTIRSPSSGEVIPPAVGNGAGTGCVLSAPWCVIHVTSGHVMENTAGFPTTEQVQLFASMTSPALAVAATWDGGSSNLITNDGGLTWSDAIPTGSLNRILPGNQKIDYNATMPDSYTGDIPTTQIYAAQWNIDLPTVMSVTSVGLTVNTGNPSADALTGDPSEASTPWLCVDAHNGQLWNATAFTFDISNIDDMDGFAAPTLSWTSPSVGPLSVTGKPPVASPPYTGNGFVGPENTNKGSLNTIRRYRMWPKGTLFARDTTTVIINAVRPGDNAQTAGVFTIPVHWAPTAANCQYNDTSVAPSTATGPTS